MHFEVPKSKTFKEFGGEYLMIVISILTALALESLVESLHHRHLAHEASQRIEAELHSNVSNLKQVLVKNKQHRDALNHTRKQMMEALRAHIGDGAFMERFDREWKTSVVVNLEAPTLRREAWEAAVANQAVTWLPQPALEKYATSYAQIRDVSGTLNGGILNMLDGPRMQDVIGDIEIGSSNPRDIFHIVTQMVSFYDNFDGNLEELSRELDAAVPSSAASGHQ